MESPQKALWKETERIRNRFNLGKNLLQAAQLPQGKKLLRTEWVYRVKYRANGELKSYKARLVVCGYAQIFIFWILMKLIVQLKDQQA